MPFNRKLAFAGIVLLAVCAYARQVPNAPILSIAQSAATPTPTATPTPSAGIMTDGSMADVQAKINAAARNAIILVPAGSFTWPSNIGISKGVSIQGAGRDSTTISGTGLFVYIAPDTTAITNEETIRVEGFTYNGGNSALNMVQVIGAGNTASKPFKNLAVGNNRFKNSGTVTSGSGVFLIQGQVRGVIYNNLIDRCNVIVKALGNNDTGTEWSNGHFPLSFGTADNLYFEDNTITWSSACSASDPGWIESGQGGRIAVRYNSWNFTNATNATDLWDIHGFQNWPGNGQTGTMVAEYYGNTLINTTAWYLWIAHRGSWGLFHNNIMTGSNAGGIYAQQYGLGDNGGSGCTAQVPGASGFYTAEINNTYVFNNTVNGVGKNMVPRTDLGVQPPAEGCGCAENVNWWNYNASFDGSAGIGRGTTAPVMSATNGTAYWVNATATPSVNPDIVQAGHLYKRVAGVWTDYYHPFTYPHPLR